LGLFCRVELPEPISNRLKGLAGLLKGRRKNKPEAQDSGPPNVKTLEDKFNQGVVRFRALVGRLKAKVKGTAPEPEVQNN
jgi:hypothetical protein